MRRSEKKRIKEKWEDLKLKRINERMWRAKIKKNERIDDKTRN
jgi:hypothetical protein